MVTKSRVKGTELCKNKIRDDWKVGYFKNINQALDVQQIADMLQCGGNVTIDERSFIEREKAAETKMLNFLRIRHYNVEETAKIFEQYGKVIQSMYFEIEVQIGICMQVELLLKQGEESKKGKRMMTTEEFKEHLFDVINEANEILIRDVKVDEELGDIVVTVFDGSEFAVGCERK